MSRGKAPPRSDLQSTRLGRYGLAMTTPAAAVAATAATVKAAIERAGLSVNRAAALSGIAQSTLDRRLLGTPPGFTISELSSLASLLGVDVSDLLRQDVAGVAA